MTLKLVSFLFLTFCFINACDDKQTIKSSPPITEPLITPVSKSAPSEAAYNNTKGYWDNGELATEFDCPDSKFFAPIDINAWDKTPAVNGRFPTYEETMNGTAIHHYGEKPSTEIKPYNMILPKLAYYENGPSKLVFDSKTLKEVKQAIPVIVIQIAQTATDTVVSYRYLTGGCGGSGFHKFHFLTDEEVREVLGETN